MPPPEDGTIPAEEAPVEEVLVEGEEAPAGAMQPVSERERNFQRLFGED